ncbi:MAG: hypothetical protein CMJ32_01885 [Phycisphaerae bacterium]|nr:hypothetical protein [Phycisphaerae bacterium]
MAFWPSRILLNDQDWTLMQRVASGDEAAVADLYDRFGPLVFKAACQVLPTRAEAEDAVQEVFVRLWKTADRYDPRRAKLVTWVILIARRHMIDRLRRKSSRPLDQAIDIDACEIGGESAESGSESITSEQGARLRNRIKQLPELQRTVIEKAYLQGYTLREVSEQLDSPLGTVKSALSRGLGRLRDRIDNERAM